MKKILVPYASYGNGHRLVAEYIKEYFESQGHSQVKLIDITDYASAINRIVSKKLFEKTMFVKIPVIWDFIYKFYNNKYRSMGTDKVIIKLFDKKRLRKEVMDYQPDIVISTHYFGSMIMAKYIKKKLINPKLYTIITDYEIHEFWLKSLKYEDAIFVGNKEMRTEAIKQGIDKKKIVVSGIPISANFSLNYNKEKLKQKFKIKNDKQIILFFGGGNNSTSSLPFLKCLLNAHLDLNIFFIAGKNTKLKEKATKLVKDTKTKNIKILGYVNKVYEYMEVSDLVITKPGGLTVSECLALAKPMLIINLNAGQEKANYKYLVKNNYAFKAARPYKFIKYLKYINTNPQVLQKMSNKMKKKQGLPAMEKIYQIIMGKTCK